MSKAIKNNQKLLRMVCLCAVLVFCVSMLHTQTLRADIFLKPGQSQKVDVQKTRKSLWSKLWGKNKETTKRNSITASKNTQRRTSNKKHYKRKSTIRYNGFEIYHAARKIDPELLRAGSREPQSPEELMLVSAAHNTAKVAHALASRRKNRETRAKMEARDNRLKLRRDLAKAQAQKLRQQKAQLRQAQKQKSAASTPKSAKTRLYMRPNEKKSSRKVFTNF